MSFLTQLMRVHGEEITQKLIIQIHHTTPAGNGDTHRVRFVHVAFNEIGEQLAAADHRGNIFIIDLNSNKFWLLPNLGICTVIAFSPHKSATLLLGTVDRALNFINTETGDIMGSLVGHTLPAKQVSFSCRGRYCLTVSSEEAIIWDSETLTQAHKLTMHTNVAIKQVMFMPVSDYVLACFQDDAMNVWKFETFECVKQIIPDAWKSHHLKSIAFTRNGRAMVIGGHTSSLVVFALDTWTVKKLIQLPEGMGGVRHIQFLPQMFDGGANKMYQMRINDTSRYFESYASSATHVNTGLQSGGTVTTNNPGADMVPRDQITCTIDLRGKVLILYSILIKGKTTLSTPDRDSNLELPIIGSLVYCESSTLDHVNTEAGRFTCSGNGKYVAGVLHSGEVNVYHGSRLLDQGSSLLSDDTPVERVEEARRSTTPTKKLPAPRRNQTSLQRQLAQVDKQIKEELTLERLRPILKQFCEYPESYRPLIWRTILEVPRNQAAFVGLVNRGVHPSYQLLDKDYPMENRPLIKNLKRVLSCLSHWSTLFGQVKYLPAFVFPFVKVLQNDPLACFEVVLTIIVNWCQFWFEYFPFPPINILAMVENVLEEHDPDLLEYLCQAKVTSQLYAWPLLHTAFSEVLVKNEWMAFWDHVFSNEPSFLLMAVVAYNITLRATVKSCKTTQDFEFFYSNPNPIDIKRFISKTYHLLKKTKDEIHPRQYLRDFEPLNKGAYPVFTGYPKNIVDYQARHLEQIQEEEAEMVREKQAVSKERAEQEKKLEEQARTQIQEDRLEKLESVYRATVRQEEERISRQRQKVMSLRRELRDRELELLKGAKDKIMRQNTRQRQATLERLLDDINHKRSQEEAELAMAKEEMRRHYTQIELNKKELECQLGVGQMIGPSLSMEHRLIQQQQEQLDQEMRKLRTETNAQHHAKQVDVTARIGLIDELLQRVETELAKEMALRQHNLETNHENLQVLHLESETKTLEVEVQRLLEQLTQLREQEGTARLGELQNSLKDRREMNQELHDWARKHRTNREPSSVTELIWACQRSQNNSTDQYNKECSNTINNKQRSNTINNKQRSTTQHSGELSDTQSNEQHFTTQSNGVCSETPYGRENLTDEHGQLSQKYSSHSHLNKASLTDEYNEQTSDEKIPNKYYKEQLLPQHHTSIPNEDGRSDPTDYYTEHLTKSPRDYTCISDQNMWDCHCSSDDLKERLAEEKWYDLQNKKFMVYPPCEDVPYCSNRLIPLRHGHFYTRDDDCCAEHLCTRPHLLDSVRRKKHTTYSGRDQWTKPGLSMAEWEKKHRLKKIEVALCVSHFLLMSFDNMKPKSGDWAMVIYFLQEAAITLCPLAAVYEALHLHTCELLSKPNAISMLP
uniref:TBC1 domain family member 31 n=1 Tax=Timema monikensis TaxID=170555 RepID=A0A7R9EGS9_9NEOP|nr:unnamed protein product [Timema monikensis]